MAKTKDVHVFHTTFKAWLNGIRMPSVQPHYECPAECCEHWPRVFSHLFPHFVRYHSSSLQSQPGQGKHYPCKHINHYLLVDRALDASAKHQVATNKACNERMRRRLFAGRGHAAEKVSCRFVDCRKSCKVASMLKCRFENNSKLLSYAAVQDCYTR